MKHFLTGLITLLFAAQSMAVSMSKLAQRQKWTQTAAHAEEDAQQLLERIQFNPAKPDPNYFQKFRIELNRLAQEEQIVAKEKGVFSHSLMKLPVDTFGFFVATGAINFMTMWNNAGGNPLLFQEQVLNLKDPVATLSFYSFMAANGFYSEFKTNRLSSSLTPEMQALKIRGIAYHAMAAGSLASSIVADLGSTIKSCANSWLPAKPHPALNGSLLEKFNEEKQKSDQLCNQANQIWSTRNLSQKYLPQIFSLLIVQGATEVLQNSANQTISVGAKALYSSLLKAGEKAGFEMLFVRIAFSATPSRLAIQSFAIVGKLTQFAFFVGVDHLLSNTLTRGFNNLFKPLLFKFFDESYLNGLFEVGGKYQWDTAKISKLRPLFDPTSRPNKDSVEGVYSFEKFETSLPEEIKNFTTQLQGWRDHLNSDAETNLNSWLTMTTRIINQLQVSEAFYKTYLTNLFSTSNISYRIQLPETDSAHLSTSAYNNIPIYPYRTLPLFGVRFIATPGSNLKEENAYLSNPSDLEKLQSQFLVATANQIINENKIKSFHIPNELADLATQTVQSLLSGNPTLQGIALQKFMVEYKRSISNNNVEFRLFGKYLTALIGNPSPRLNQGEGFNAAFVLENKSQLQTADFDLVDSTVKVNFTDAGQYLSHAMICGDSQGLIKENTSLHGRIKWWEPDFLPPSIVTTNAKEICAATSHGVSSETFYTQTLTNPTTNKTYKNMTDYLVHNLDPAVLGDYRDKEKIADFNAWWRSHVMAQIPATLENWDKGYSELVDQAMGNIFDQKSLINKTVDRLTQFNWLNDNLMGSSLVDSFRFEKEFYLQTINLVRTKAKFNLPAKGNVNILNESKKIALGEKGSVLSRLTQKEYQEISTTLELLISELAKPVVYLNHDDQIRSDEELKKDSAYANRTASQLDYKKYLALETQFENAVSALEATVGLKVLQKSSDAMPLPGQDSPQDVDKYEPVDLKTLNFEQGVVQAATAGLRNISENISKYVRMKVLMRRGLTFTKEELVKFQKNEKKQACAQSTHGC